MVVSYHLVFVCEFECIKENTHFHSSYDICKEQDLIESIPSIISQDVNDALMKPFPLEEIRKVVFSFPLDKTPSLEGIHDTLLPKNLGCIRLRYYPFY